MPDSHFGIRLATHYEGYDVTKDYSTDEVVWWNGRCWRAKQAVPKDQNNFPGGVSPTRWGKARAGEAPPLGP